MRPLLILWLLFAASETLAHRFAPSLLEVTQLSEQTFSASWKTPIQQVSPTPIEPHFPAACQVSSESPWVQEGTGMLMQTQYECPQGLIGETLSVSGLGENQSSALLRVRLTGGIFIRRCSPPPSPTLPCLKKVPLPSWQWITAGWALSIFGRAPIICSS